jgi:tetratricopeptide (TPR) repeat protein
MLRDHLAFPLLICTVLVSCAANKQKEEERIRKILESSAGYHIEKGSAASDSGRYDEALKHLREAAALAPFEPVAFNNLGVTFYRMGLLDSAINAYQTAIRLRPGFARAYVNLANVYLQQKNYRFALSAANNAIKTDSMLAAGYAMRGMLYDHYQQQDDAIADYQRAIALAPDEITSYINLGVIYFQKGMIDESIEQYQRAIAINPQSLEGHFNLGNAYARKCMPEEAKEQYQTALKIQPALAFARNNYGMLLMSQNQINEAIAQFEQALQTNRNEATVLLNLSIAFTRADSLQKALSYIEQAIANDSSRAMFYIQRGNILMKLDQPGLALDSYNTAIALEPNLAATYNNLGNALLASNNPKQASAAFEKALELYPDYIQDRYFAQGENVEKGMTDMFGPCSLSLQVLTDYAEIYNNLGKVQLQMGQVQAAELSFKRATQMQPLLIEPLFNLGITYQRQNKQDLASRAFAMARLNKAKRLFAADSLAEAETFCVQALSIDPELAGAYAQLGLIYDRLNNPSAAEKSFRKALSLNPNDLNVMLSYGKRLARHDRWREAKSYFEKASRLDAKSAEANEKLAEALSALGMQQQAMQQQARFHYLTGQGLEYAANWDRALEEYAVANRLDSANADYPAAQGIIYAKKHLHQQAESFFLQALKMNPENARALYGMGLIDGDRKNYKDAIEYLEKAVASDSSFAAAHYTLAVNYYFEKEFTKAWLHVRQAKKFGYIVRSEFINELEAASQGR